LLVQEAVAAAAVDAAVEQALPVLQVLALPEPLEHAAVRAPAVWAQQEQAALRQVRLQPQLSRQQAADAAAVADEAAAQPADRACLKR
jgi:hypothetical protein